MKKKRMIILVFQIILVVGFALSFYSYVQKETEPTEVYIYSTDISEVNTEITVSHIEKTTIPAKAVTSEMARKPEDIIGKYLSTKVFAGQYVYSKQLLGAEQVDIFDSIDLSEMRKISLPISYEDGFSGNIKRGDRVDAVFTGEGTVQGDYGGQDSYNYAKVFLQDLLVYSVTTKDGYSFVDHSQYAQGYVGNEDAQTISTEDVSDEIAVITLAVTLEQAEEIEARTSKGKVRLLGRFDTSESYETLGYVLGDYSKTFSGTANAETDSLRIEADTFEKVD